MFQNIQTSILATILEGTTSKSQCLINYKSNATQGCGVRVRVGVACFPRSRNRRWSRYKLTDSDPGQALITDYKKKLFIIIKLLWSVSNDFVYRTQFNASDIWNRRCDGQLTGDLRIVWLPAHRAACALATLPVEPKALSRHFRNIFLKKIRNIRIVGTHH